MIFSSSLEQNITLPTRTAGNSVKFFDHIWCNCSSTVQSGVYDTGISNHPSTFAFIPSCIEMKLTYGKFRDHTECCLEALENYLTNKINLSETFKVRWDGSTNFDEKFSLFSSELYKLSDSCCPIITKVVSNNRLSKPWLTPDIMILNRRKYYLYKRVKRNAIPYCVYQAYCNTLAKKVNKATVV